MKAIKSLVILIIILFSYSCEKDDNREELPGIPTSISGNVKDYHRNIYVSNFEIKLL